MMQLEYEQAPQDPIGHGGMLISSSSVVIEYGGNWVRGKGENIP